MTKKEFRHIWALIELCLGCIFFLIFLYGLIFNNLECSVWGFIGGTIFGVGGAIDGNDHYFEDPYEGLDD